MPSITLTLSGTPNLLLTSTLSQEIMALTADVLGNQPSQTTVIVVFVDPALWFIDSQSLSSPGLNPSLSGSLCNTATTSANQLQ